MRPPDRRRASLLRLAALAAAFAACGNEERGTFDPARDDVAMVAIASTWSGDALALALCEDTARSAAWTGPDHCVVDHVVRGGGLGLSHTESVSDGGCGGGCEPGAVAYVRGTVSAAALGGEARVTGTVRLQSTGAPDPYAFPYTLTLVCDAPAECAVNGTLREDGSIEAILVDGPRGPGQAESRHDLSRTGAATCP